MMNRFCIRADGFQAVEEFGFAANVEMCGRLVQEQDCRIADQCPREADRLLLSAGEALAALGDRHLVAERMTGDEGFDARKPRSLDDLLVGGFGIAERDVVAELAEEQIGVLQHEADARAQVGRIVLSQIDIVDQDLSVLRIVEAGYQPPDRRLAGADTSDDADALAAADTERSRFQGRFARPRDI